MYMHGAGILGQRSLEEFRVSDCLSCFVTHTGERQREVLLSHILVLTHLVQKICQSRTRGSAHETLGNGGVVQRPEPVFPVLAQNALFGTSHEDDRNKAAYDIKCIVDG